MITVRQIERYWSAQSYKRLFRELLAVRPEASLRLEMELGRSIPTAALAAIRLDELSQSFVPLFGKLLRTILNDQHSDGGWGDPMTTALCLKALMSNDGNGVAIDRGLEYLASIQKTDGIWPNGPIRRLPADPFASAFILLQLGDKPAFRQSVRFFEAITWFETNEDSLEPDARKLWDRARVRCGIEIGEQKFGVHLWS